jgi:hypothetical protein
MYRERFPHERRYLARQRRPWGHRYPWRRRFFTHEEKKELNERRIKRIEQYREFLEKELAGVNEYLENLKKESETEKQTSTN